ncbi:MAG: family 5 extracellular solute-binding protein, peptide/nickel transport system substrate-binding protein, partial [Candidatus Peregrinibacteria bacterium GW2011_GWE2_39_6]
MNQSETKTKKPKLNLSENLIISLVGLALILIAVTAYYFFEKPTIDNSSLYNAAQPLKEELTIAYDQPLLTYEAATFDSTSRSYLANTYEALVSFDRNFKIRPALALSWGMINDTTWQFKLRPDLTFHDQSSFEASDVIASFKRAKSNPLSETQNLVTSIKEVKAVDDLTILIITKNPDPILLNKLTAIYIIPAESPDHLETPIGTGPYSFIQKT